MNDRTFEHAVREWLDAGSDRTPPDAIDAVLLAVKTTPQERDLRIPRRFTLMASSMRLAAGVAIAAIVGVAALALINQSPGAGTRATPTPQPTASAAAVESPGVSPATSAQPTAPPSVFTSPLYHYTIDLPAGWTAYPAMLAWDGTGSPGHDTAEVDQFKSSTGTVAWAFAAPTTKSVAAFSAERTAADAVEHPCGTTPEIDESTTVDGDPARLTVKHCEPVGGILVANTVVIRLGTGYVFYIQHPPEDTADPEDFEVLRTLLSGVKLP
jgi:hypothetical protein